MPQTESFFFQFPQGASIILLTVQYVLEISGKVDCIFDSTRASKWSIQI